MLTIYTLLILLLTLQCEAALSYYISTSCQKGLGKNFADGLAEVQLMASEGSARLRNENDKIMASQFKAIFKVDKTDTTFLNKVIGAFDKIAAMRATENRATSDIRFYCDNDPFGDEKRWRPWSGVKDGMWDGKNQIVTSGRGCQQRDKNGKFEELYGLTYMSPYNPSDGSAQNPNRHSITICDRTFKKKPYLMSSKYTAKELLKHYPTVDKYDYFLNIVLFHELCHTKQILDIPGGHELFGWKQTVHSSASEAQKNADPYAYLGLLAMLNKRGVRLSTKNENAGKGVLKKIDNPKRALEFVS